MKHIIKIGSKGVLNYVLALQEHFEKHKTVTVVARGHAIDRMIQAIMIYDKVFSKYELEMKHSIDVSELEHGYTPIMKIEVKRK